MCECVPQQISSKVHQKPNISNHIRLDLKSKNCNKDFYRTIMNISYCDAKQSLFWDQTLLVRLTDKTLKTMFNTCFNTVKNIFFSYIHHRDYLCFFINIILTYQQANHATIN